MLKDDIKILQEKQNVPEAAFKVHYPEVYQRVVEHARMLSRNAWNEAKYLYINQVKSLPTCKICGNLVEFRSSSRGYRNTCSRKCDLLLKAQTHKQMWEHYTAEQRAAHIKRVEDTREAKTGYRTPFANPEVRRKFNVTKTTKC